MHRTLPYSGALTAFAVAQPSSKQETTLYDYGLLKTTTFEKIVLLKNNVLVSFNFNPNKAKAIYNDFISSLDELLNRVHDPSCLNEVLVESRSERVQLKEFLDNYNVTDFSKIKRRQLFWGTVGAISGLVSLGITQMEMGMVNSKIDNLKNKVGQDEKRLEILNNIVSYNSKELINMFNVQKQTSKILNTLKNQALTNSRELNDVKSALICINARDNFSKLVRSAEKVIKQIKNILDYKFDPSMISSSLKAEVCSNLNKHKFVPFGRCSDFNLMREIDYIVLPSRKIIILAKLPIQNDRESYSLIRARTLPVKLGKHYGEIQLGDDSLALGMKFRVGVKINECLR